MPRLMPALQNEHSASDHHVSFVRQLLAMRSASTDGSRHVMKCRKRGAQPAESFERARRPDQDVWAKPQLALQGIAPAARVRLLACALASIEKQISALPDALDT